MGNPVWQAVLFGLALLFLAFEIWRGWRAGIVRSGVVLAALVLSSVVGFYAGLAASMPFGGPKELPGIFAGVLIGGGIGVVVFVVIWVLGAVLFKRTAHQGSGIFKFIWGFGGAFFGFCIGLIILWGGISIIRVAGSLAESRVEAAKGQSPGANPAPPPLLEGSLVKLKDSMELGPVGKVVDAVDVLPPDTYLLIGQMGTLTSDPETAMRFIEYPGIQQIAQNPRVVQLVNNPEIIKAFEAKNYLGLLNNKAIHEALEDPALVKQLQQIDIRAALKFALEKTYPDSLTLSPPVQAQEKIMSSEYIATIGLEVHVQCKTRTKMFCGCAVEYGAEPNSNVCPVCLGLPGALPVMNEAAMELTVLAGLMLGCDVPPTCKFDRKNYFYPDMPKNYQISQYDLPFCLGGHVPLHDLAYPKDAQKNIATKDKQIRLTRIHLEEDVAKSFHMENSTGIDFNRAGTPLMEIVSEADIANADEAFAYLTVLQQVMVYGGISDADMEKGQMRCDVNISVRKGADSPWGTKIEIKNLNTISGVRRALLFEIPRQIAAYEAGQTLDQETRRWDDTRGETTLMRIKESAHDYRYFPDPDLLPVRTEAIIIAAKSRKPELPWEKRARYVADFGVTEYDAAVIANDLATSAYFETAAKGAKKPKNVANWLLNDLQSALSGAGKEIADCPIPPESLDELVNLIDDGKINSKQGKDVFAEMFATGKRAGVIVKEKGLEQMSDTGAIEALCDEAIANSPKAVAEYLAGKGAAINSIKGQVMKLSKGQANPQVVGEILERKLKV